MIGFDRLIIVDHFFAAGAVVADAGGNADGVVQLGAVLQIKAQLACFDAGIRCINSKRLAVRGGRVVNIHRCAAAKQGIECIDFLMAVIDAAQQGVVDIVVLETPR